MRIAFLTPHINISGGVKMILGYADRFAKRGHKVMVVCPQPVLKAREIPLLYPLVYPFFYPKVAVMNFLGRKPGWTDMAADVRYICSCRERYIPDGDIIVATAWETAPYVKGYSFEKGRKVYFIQHYESLYHGDKAKVDETYKYLMKRIVVSSWLKGILKKNFNSDSELIINPVDLNIFYPTRKTYNKKKICMLHHIFEWKGINDGIKAFEIAQKAYLEIQLLMFGSRKKTVGINCEYHFRFSTSFINFLYSASNSSSGISSRFWTLIA